MKIMLRFEIWATGWFIAHGKKSEAGSRGGRSGEGGGDGRDRRSVLSPW